MPGRVFKPKFAVDRESDWGGSADGRGYPL